MAGEVTRRGRDRGAEAGGEGHGERLQKVLAARGVASRRAAEELIQEGRVTVDGRVVQELGTRVDPERAAIRVDGRPLKQPRATYLLLNKPRGYLTTASDPEGRRTVYDLLLDQRERVFPVGRLDMDSEGLLLLTNDGELANRIAHPRYRLDKEYHALVAGTPTPQELDHLRRGGLLVEGGRTSPADIAVLDRGPEGTWLRVIIHEGRKRQVRRMLEAVGHPVRRLRRVRLGPLTLAGLPAATYRPLTPQELARLRRMVGLGAAGDAADTEGAAAPAARQDERAPARRAQTQELGAGRPRSTRRRPVGFTPEEPAGGRARRIPDRGTGRDGDGGRDQRGRGPQSGGDGRGGSGGRGGAPGGRPQPARRGRP